MSLRRALDDASGGLYSASAVEPDEFTVVQLVVTPTVDHDEYSSPSITIDLIGNRRLQADVLVAVSRGDEDRHDDIKNLAKGFCRGQDVKLASTFSYEDDDLFFHHVSLKLDRRGAVVRELYVAAVSLHDLCQKFDEAKSPTERSSQRYCELVVPTSSLGSTSLATSNARVRTTPYPIPLRRLNLRRM